MTNNNHYETQEFISNSSIRFLFVSHGNQEIIKVIDYSIVRFKTEVIRTEKIFNLGFGNYDLDSGHIDDSDISDNGDVYKVLTTVLSTIPHFFNVHPNEAIMVTGSDSTKDYIDNCLLTCRKKCAEAHECKNQHRRINIYRGYVNKNFENLCKDYTFYGGLGSIIEDYIPQKDYDSVFIIKNN